MSATAEAPYQRHWLSVADYLRMGEAGILGEDDRVELIEGEIIDMSPIGTPHSGAVNRIAKRIILAVGERATVGVQNPMRIGDFSAPQPDIAVLAPREDIYAARHPEPADCLLLIEVAETSLPYDRDKKLPLYARAGIPEVWLVDLPGRTLWVYRQPAPGGYAEVRPAADLASLAPAALPDCVIDLTGLF
jgi:Uma2 family endonuclease